MGGSHIYEGLDLFDSDAFESSDFSTPPPASTTRSSSATAATTPASIDAPDRHLRSLHLKYSNPISPNTNPTLTLSPPLPPSTPSSSTSTSAETPPLPAGSPPRSFLPILLSSLPTLLQAGPIKE